MIAKTKKQVELLARALAPGVVSLIRDVNGNHVVQRCLQAREETDYFILFIIYKAAT